MMNLQSLRSNESLGVKFKDGIWAELYLKFWFEIEWRKINVESSKLPLHNITLEFHALR